jgi:hypothetical protein
LNGTIAQFVMAGHSRSKNGVASLAYVPAIHVFFPRLIADRAWMPGTIGVLSTPFFERLWPGMTMEGSAVAPTSIS